MRDRLIACGAEALLKARHPDLRTVPPMEKLMAAQVALVVVDAISEEYSKATGELRRRLDDAEKLLRVCQGAFHREGWEPGESSDEVSDRVDDFIAQIDIELAIEKAEGRA